MAFVAMRVRNNTFAAICTGSHTLLLSLCAYNIMITTKHIMCNCIHNSQEQSYCPGSGTNQYMKGKNE